MKKFTTEGIHPIIGNHKFVHFSRWTNNDVKEYTLRYERIRPFLNELGINEDVKIICFDNAYFNSSLFLANRKGWTGFVPITDQLMNDYIKNGAQFLLVDKDKPQFGFMQKYYSNKLGNFEGVHVFKLP